MLIPLLTRYLTAPSRRWIVITLTLIVSVVIVWPAADEYQALSVNQVRLDVRLAEVREVIGALPALESKAAEQGRTLASMESQIVKERNLHLFRGRLVELARATGCQIRQIRVNPARHRPWRGTEHVLTGESVAGDGTPPPYQVTILELSISLLGPQAKTESFLMGLAELEVVAHAQQVSLIGMEGQEGEVALEISLWLLDLNQAASDAAA